MVIDPSVSVNAIEKELQNQNASLIGILLTHGHFDHIISIDTLREKYNVPVYIHKKDACMLTDGKLNGFYMFFERDCIHKPADILFSDGDEISIGNEKLKILHTPGHSLGSSCFIFKDEDNKSAIVTGDTLFANAVGRTDLYGGNLRELIASIKKLASFDKASQIYPGHGEINTLGEAINNVSYIFDF